MPWWFWIVLWGSLVVASLVLLAYLLFLTLKKGWKTLSEVEAWEAAFSSRLSEAHSVSYRKLESPSESAIFTPVGEAVSHYESGKLERKIDRAVRRYQRRETLGQPQRVDDLRIYAQEGAD